MLDDRPLIAAKFRQLAAEYGTERLAKWTQGGVFDGYSARDPSILDEEAGKLVIAAFHRGYLSDVPALGQLVAWVENPPPFPAGAKAMLHPCAGNLFSELCGNNSILAQKQPDGTWKPIADRTHGGILPSVFPDLLPGHKTGARAEETGRARQRVAICHWLADVIQAEEKESPPSDAQFYRPKVDLMKIFGVKSVRVFDRFMQRHPKIRTDRPKTKDGRPHPRRISIHLLDFVQALRNDDRLARQIASKKRIEKNMQRLELGEELEKAALGLFGL